MQLSVLAAITLPILALAQNQTAQVRNYGGITVQYTKTNSTSSTLYVVDSLSDNVAGIDVPHTEQNSVCEITEGATIGSWYPCFHGAWDWQLGNGFMVTVRHIVKFKNAYQLGGTYDNLKNVVSDKPVTSRRWSSQIPVWMNAGSEPASKQYSVSQQFGDGWTTAGGAPADYIDATGALVID